jgi:hydrogenase maturation protease
VSSNLILYLGNPIVKNDQVGLIAGSHIARLYSSDPRVEVREFSGSPLDLISEIQGYQQLILIDSIATGKQPTGTVSVFSEEEILAEKGDIYLHGMNLSEALKLGHRLQLPVPERLHLVGIEAGVIYEFAENLSPELREALPGIKSEVKRIVEGLIT